MVLVNKIRVLGSEDWSDSKVTRLFMRAYKEKDKSLARMIRDRDEYEEMTPHQLFARIQQHESEEAPIKTRDTHALISNEQDSPKKNKDHKAKKVVETLSDEDSSSDEDTAIFIKTFKKFVRKNDKFQRKGKKRACYECGQTGHFTADCPNKKEQEAKKEYKKDKFKKGGKNKGYFKKKKYGQAHIGEEWNSDEESSSSEEEEVVANVAIQSTSSSQLFTNLHDDSYTPTCLMAKGDKVYSSGGSSWVLDSGCTNHITGEKDMFDFLQLTQEAQEIVFGDSGKSKVIGIGKIPISDQQSLSNVLLVDSLSYNLMSVSQLCGMGYNCLFSDVDVKILRREDSSVAFTGRLKGKLYLVDFTTSKVTPETCLVAKSDKGWLWHRRLAHVGMRNLAKLQNDSHIIGLTNVVFEKDRVCGACQAGKQHGVPHQSKNVVTAKRPLELLHMDIFSPVAYISIGGSKYGLVIIDDFSRFTWVFFLSDKGETQETLKKFMRRAQNEFELKIKKVRSDNGTEFKNTGVEEFLSEEGIKHEFSVPCTPQQNGVVERRNRTLIEAARTMLDEYKTPDNFWAKAVNTAFHAINRLYLHKVYKKTAYELLTGNEEPPCEAIKKLAIGEVRPQEKDDEEGTLWMTNEVFDVGTKVVGDKSSTQANPSTSSHPSLEEVHQPQKMPTMVEGEYEGVDDEVTLDQVDDDEEQIQRQPSVPHPRVHHM
jgi:transposase InsO family protein